VEGSVQTSSCFPAAILRLDEVTRGIRKDLKD
jgi:hypothetical protein